MKQHLLLITKPADDEMEDNAILVAGLKRSIEITLCAPEQSVALLSGAHIVLLRNIRTSRISHAELKSLFHAISASGTPCYNPVAGHELKDKSYLALLTRLGYPVIPSITDKKELNLLGQAERYLLKPLWSDSSQGIRSCDAARLAQEDMQKCVIQPYVTFDAEVSFFFIDNIFVYALRSKAHRWDLALWTPPAVLIDWAQQFVAWRKMPYGLLRIDAAQLANGQLLLMEIEDLAPFLSLQVLPQDIRGHIIEKLAASLLAQASKSLPHPTAL